MHFGGTRSHVSLHTAVLYTKDTAMSFCTISESTNDSPQGIWVHMDPVLQQIRTTMTEVKYMHFINDGPTTQYRSKNNFYLINKLIHSKYVLLRSMWNFTEAGHEKGAADGVGAVVKRPADSIVAKGTYIENAKDLFKHVREKVSKGKLYLIDDASIASITFPNSNQIISFTTNQIFLSVLRCFSKWPEACDCLKNDPASHRFSDIGQRRETIETDTVHQNDTEADELVQIKGSHQ